MIVHDRPMVFSIRPRYVDLFRSGEKQAEFRTQRPIVLPGDLVLVYETAPTSQIVAEAIVGNIVDDTPAAVWEQAEFAGGIDSAEFDRYFDGRSRAVAIWLTMRWLDEPVPLPEGMAAPQSWARYKGTWRERGRA